MLRTRKTPLVTVFVLLVIATLFGCSLLLRDGAEQSGWYIKLNINHPAVAKALTVTEYDVTGLAIEVYDPDGELIEEISWQVAEGQQSYLIPVSEQGQHKIVVTHISEENGETVEAEESATFNIQAMVITVIDIIPGCIGMIEVEPGIQDGPPAEDVNECALAVMTALWEAMAPLYQGSDEFPPGVTVDESNFIPPGDDPPFGGIVIVAFTDYTPSGSDVTVNGDITIEITFPPDLLGTFEEAISASLSVSCLPGETVDIDLTLSMFMEDAPYWQTLQWAGAITVDGQEADLDQVMSDWLEMVLGPATPTDGTLTVRVTGADAYNGALFHYAVGAIGTDLYDQANWLGVAPSNLTISGGMVEFITIVNGTNTPAYFTSGVSYDVAALIDVDGDNWPTSNVDYIYGPEPVVVNGDTILELDFAADFHLVPLSDSFGIVIGDYAEYRLTDHMTLEAWVFPRASASTNGRRNVIISKSPWVSNAGYSMYIEGSSLIVDNHNKGLHTAVVDESFFDSWHHVAWSFDAPVSSIYIDGVLRSSRSYWSAMGVSDKPLTIGSYPTVPNGQFAGCICDVSIWSVARTGDDIVNDYQGIDPSTAGLAGFWKLNDGSGLTALDLGPFKYDGTLTGGGIGFYPIWVMLVGPLTSGNRWVVDFDECCAEDTYEPVLDQDNLYGTCCSIDMMYPDLYQQTVTAGMPGVLSRIWVQIGEGFGDGIVRFSLYEGTATPASTPLFTQDIDTLSLDTEDFVWDVTSQNLGLDQGTVFTFGIQGIKNGNGARVADDQDNQYGDGELLINGAPFDPPRDLAFRTYVLE